MGCRFASVLPHDNAGLLRLVNASNKTGRNIVTPPASELKPGDQPLPEPDEKEKER